MLELKVIAINIPTVPRGTTSQARCCSSTHFSSPKKKALENPSSTRCLSTCILTTWHHFPEERVTSTYSQKTVQNWHGFACGLKSSFAIPSNLSARSMPVPGLTPPAFQQSFLAALHFKTFLIPWLFVEQSDTKDRKSLKLKIQSIQECCVWLNKGKYLTSWCPGFQMSSPAPVESVSDSLLFHLYSSLTFCVTSLTKW